MSAELDHYDHDNIAEFLHGLNQLCGDTGCYFMHGSVYINSDAGDKYVGDITKGNGRGFALFQIQ